MRTKEELEKELEIAKEKEQFWLKKVREADKEMERLDGEYPYHLYENHKHFESVVKTLSFVLGDQPFI